MSELIARSPTPKKIEEAAGRGKPTR